MVRIIRALLLGLLLICPACGRGRMFRSFFTMNVRCPNCGVIFERDPGEITGGMGVNTVVSSTLGFVLMAIGLIAGVPTLPLIAGLVVFMLGFPVLFYRHARGVWTGFLYLSGAMFED